MVVSRRNMLAAAAAGSVFSASAARAVQLGNPDSPAEGPRAIQKNPHSGTDPGPRSGSRQSVSKQRNAAVDR
jgi:hypothetical protein